MPRSTDSTRLKKLMMFLMILAVKATESNEPVPVTELPSPSPSHSLYDYSASSSSSYAPDFLRGKRSASPTPTNLPQYCLEYSGQKFHAAVFYRNNDILPEVSEYGIMLKPSDSSCPANLLIAKTCPGNTINQVNIYANGLGYNQSSADYIINSLNQICKDHYEAARLMANIIISAVLSGILCVPISGMISTHIYAACKKRRIQQTHPTEQQALLGDNNSRISTSTHYGSSTHNPTIRRPLSDLSNWIGSVFGCARRPMASGLTDARQITISLRGSLNNEPKPESKQGIQSLSLSAKK